MREHIYLPVGEAGIRVFTRIVWNYAEERDVKWGEQGEETGGVMLETGEWGCRPRAVLVDPDDSSIDHYTASGLPPIPTLTASSSLHSTFSTGYSQGPVLLDSLLTSLHHLAERCDSLTNIHLLHSLGGGSGSGLGAYIIEHLADMYPESLLTTTSILPSPLCSDIVTEPYNALLSLQSLLPHTHLTTLISNESLMRIMKTRYKLTQPTYNDLNHLAACYSTNLIPIYDTNGPFSYKQLIDNVVLWPKIPLAELGFGPLTCRCMCSLPKNDVELTIEVLNREFSLCRREENVGKFISAYVLYRGNIRKIEENEYPLAEYGEKWGLSWLSDSLKTGYSELLPRGLKRSIGSIACHTGIRSVISSILTDAHHLYSRSAFTHMYPDLPLHESLQFSHDLLCEYSEIETYYLFVTHQNPSASPALSLVRRTSSVSVGFPCG